MISIVIWGIGMYFMAKNVSEKNVELNIKPINYSILAILFGALFSGSMLGYKVAKVKNSLGGKIASIVGILFAIIMN